jgi:hypothetical protein
MDGFALVAAKGGPKFATAKPESLPDGTVHPFGPPKKPRTAPSGRLW